MQTLPAILVTTYLEMYPEHFRPSFIQDDRMNIELLNAPDVRYYRFMYSSVGEQWNWTDRLLLSDEEIRRVLTDPQMSMYVLYYDGAPAGYVELKRHTSDMTEIVYFGLRTPYWGRGLGKHLLSFGCAQAFEDGAEHVTVNTCNLDGPYAVDNYKKRGFRVCDVTEKPMPDKEFIKLTAKQRGLL